MSFELTLRVAREGDLGCIHDIQCSSYPPSHHETIDVFSSIISQGISLVAIDGEDSIVGYCLAQWLDDPHAPPALNHLFDIATRPASSKEHLFIHDCSVSESHRCKGVASKLVQSVIERLVEDKALSLSLISVDSSSAVYWQKKGFHPMASSIRRSAIRREMTAPSPLSPHALLDANGSSSQGELTSLSSVQLSRSKPSIITSQASLDSYGLDALHLEFVQGIRKDDPLIPQCLDTIAASFSSDKSSGSDFYAGLDPEIQELFWRLLSEECLSASNDEKPMMLLRGGEAAAMCVLWHPPTSSWDMKDASYWPLLTPEARDCFESCHSATGEWFNACLSLYEQQGPFYSLEFLACGVMSQGRGLASTLLSALTFRADKEGKYIFLVAMNARLMQWYSTRFGFVLKKESIFERMEGGVAYNARQKGLRINSKSKTD